MIKDSSILLNITNPKEVFALLADKDATWDEIFQGFAFINDRNNSLMGTIPRNFYMPDSFKVLEDMGLDYNHKDRYGNHFFHYVMEKLDTQKVNKDYHIFYSALIPNLLDKIENVYKLNWGGRHILFNMMTYSSGGIEGENFKEILTQYPDFDLHLVDKAGKNLFHYALMKNSPPQIVDLLIKNKINTHLIDKDNYNALNYFSLEGFNKYKMNLFSNLIRELDITNETKHNSSCVSDWISFVTSDRVRDESKKASICWLNFTCKKIIEEDFLYTDKTLNYLLKKLEDNKLNYFYHLLFLNDPQEIKSNYNNAITTIKKIQIEALLPEKQTIEKPKVKT